MFAASALVVAVLASYAGIGMLSLSASSPFSALSKLPGVSAVVKGIGWEKPDLHHYLKVAQNASSAAGRAVADVTLLQFGSLSSSGGTKAVNITNRSSAPLALTVAVHGALGVNASFAGGRASAIVAPGKPATVNVQTNAAYAGPFSGTLEISAKGLQSISVPLTGDQAPLPPGAVTATPAAGGAVDLSWAPSPSVSGVHGYVVQRSSDGTTFTQVGTVVSGTSAVDHTPSDGQYTYRVVAVANGSPALQSDPGPVGTATSDSTAPAAPTNVSAPTWITAANELNVPISVALPASSTAADTITVTLTGPSGGSVTATAPGGTTSVTVPVNAQGLGEGRIIVEATASDTVGNASAAAQTTTTKDTVPPGDPGPLGSLPDITQRNQTSYTFHVDPTAPTSPGDTVHATFQDQAGNVVHGSGSAQDGVVQMQDLSGLSDGNANITVTVWITDAAGNSSGQVQTTVSKDTVGPPAPSFVGIPAGDSNPVNVVTSGNASAVTVEATFDVAPAPDDSMVFWVNGTRYSGFQGDGQTTTFTITPPIDLSGIPDGTYTLGIVQTDGNGNSTKTFHHFTVDTGGAQAPTSIGVPAGPDNPAGYVNAATQTAATIVATFAAPTDPADQIALSVDGLSLGTQAGGSDSISWTGDLSSLPDGTLQILGTITDPNGVQTTFTGSLIKDTTPPPAPAAAGVVGPPPNVIASENASCVNVRVAFNQPPDQSDTVTVTLSDGTTSVQGSAQAGDGQVTVGCIDATSLADGPISVTVTVTDVAGNSVTFTGTQATKVDGQHGDGDGDADD